MKKHSNERIVKIISGFAFLTGMILEYLAVAILDGDHYSYRVCLGMALIGAVLIFGTILFAKWYAEYIGSREHEGGREDDTC